MLLRACPTPPDEHVCRHVLTLELGDSGTTQLGPNTLVTIVCLAWYILALLKILKIQNGIV